MKKVIVIGGGAAGMMAAYSAALSGKQVDLYEKNEKLGKKIYITGKGRRNITNACSDEEFFENIVNPDSASVPACTGSRGNIPPRTPHEGSCRRSETDSHSPHLRQRQVSA